MAGAFPYRILVVDDDEAVLQTTEAILTSAGYDVQTAHDGFEALVKLRGAVPELLIADLHMAGMSGFELLGIVRKRFPSMAVIATSGKFTPITFPEGILADHFLPKGDVPEVELLEAVRQLTSGGPVRSQPARADIAPTWVPRSPRGYVILTCTECLRSFSVPTRSIQVGRTATEPCVYCQTEISYSVDESVMADPPSVVEKSRTAADTARRMAESTRRTVEESRRTIKESREKS